MTILPTVQNRCRPRSSAVAIYTQHLMADMLRFLATMAEAEGLRVMAYVLDSIYVIADNEEKLKASFTAVARQAQSEHGLRVALKSPEGVKLALP